MEIYEAYIIAFRYFFRLHKNKKYYKHHILFCRTKFCISPVTALITGHGTGLTIWVAIL